MSLPDKQKANVSLRSLMLIMVTICKQQYTKILTAALSFPIFNLVICSLLLTFPEPHVQCQKQAEGGSKNSSSTQLSVPNMSEHIFNIFS